MSSAVVHLKISPDAAWKCTPRELLMYLSFAAGKGALREGWDSDKVHDMEEHLRASGVQV